MSLDRAEVVHQNFLNKLQAPETLNIKDYDISDAGLDKTAAIRIFKSQLVSRHLDMIARKLQKRGEAFYTIGSSGHEGNAAIAAALNVDDIAFLHYRDAAFLIERSKKKPDTNIVWDMLLSFTASSEDPIAQGRHKVLGSKELFVPPQTSTIASHLPKAVGAAFSIDLNKKLKLENTLPHNSISVCSFGDASVNHSTATGAINTAAWTSYQENPMPILFVCEDNNIGISTFTPKDWVKNRYENHAGLKYFECDGLNIFDTYKVANAAQHYVRVNRRPAFLHFNCVRLYGHAGADAQHAYMSQNQIEAMEADDPLLHSAGLLIKNKMMTAPEILDLYDQIESEIAKAAEKAIKRPKLKNAKDVMASIVPPKRKALALENKVSESNRKELFGRFHDAQKEPAHMAKLINWALHDAMLKHPEIVLAGEDIGPKGGVYNVTANLHKNFGPARVINTLLDEQTILGLSIGMAHNNILPIAEIQFLAYLHNAEDQLRGEAATLSFFSSGQYTNPMIIRVAGLAYQRGFGGHFHNDNSFNVIRDIPGVIVACPSNGADAVSMLRECIRLARIEQRIIVFLEPIALYMTKDLHEEKDIEWSFIYNDVKPISYGQVGQYGDGKELAIVTYGNGYYLSCQAMKEFERKYKTRIIDLRWLCPLPEKEILKALKGCDNILIVDECRKTGSVSEELMTLLHDKKNVARHTAEDSYIPLGKAYASTLPSKETIIKQAKELMKKADK